MLQLLCFWQPVDFNIKFYYILRDTSNIRHLLLSLGILKLLNYCLSWSCANFISLCNYFQLKCSIPMCNVSSWTGFSLMRIGTLGVRVNPLRHPLRQQNMVTSNLSLLQINKLLLKIDYGCLLHLISCLNNRHLFFLTAHARSIDSFTTQVTFDSSRPSK